jgi:DNA-binding CsgD family transcriptional regulator
LSKAFTTKNIEVAAGKRKALRPTEFVFCEKASGAPRFRVCAGPKGELPRDEAASLLAIHCLARGLSPEDYVVQIVPDGDLIGDVKTRTQQLLAAGQATLPVAIAPREREVLNGILEDLSNKEIASRLNLAVRTVKFHVSSLLAKFGVRDRVGLIREAVLGIMPTTSTPRGTLFGFQSQKRPDSRSAPASLATAVLAMPQQQRARG